MSIPGIREQLISSVGTQASIHVIDPLPPRRPVTDMVSAPHRLKLGLRALSPREAWLDLDEDLARDLGEKHALMRDHRDQVFVETQRSRAAQHEALAQVSSTLLELRPDLYRLDGRTLHVQATGDAFDLEAGTRAPLEIASLCVQEDLVVMQETRRGWCLTAGSVCFPTRWDLPTKLGRSMTEIHEQVPGYREVLDSSSNRFFDGMKPGVVFARGNWSLMDDPSLFQPEGKFRDEVDPGIDVRMAGEKIWLRVEHQTLQRLPESGAILFGIRIHRTRLDALAGDRDLARKLLDAIATMPAAMQHYKSLGAVRAACDAYLRGVIDASTPEAPR